jgi:hypothetical protein
MEDDMVDREAGRYMYRPLRTPHDVDPKVSRFHLQLSPCRIGWPVSYTLLNFDIRSNLSVFSFHVDVSIYSRFNFLVRAS